MVVFSRQSESLLEEIKNGGFESTIRIVAGFLWMLYLRYFSSFFIWEIWLCDEVYYFFCDYKLITMNDSSIWSWISVEVSCNISIVVVEKQTGAKQDPRHSHPFLPFWFSVLYMASVKEYVLDWFFDSQFFIFFFFFF